MNFERSLKAVSYFAAGRSTQAACGRVHTSTQHASEIAGNSMKIAENSIAPLVEMQRKMKYAAKYEPAIII